MAEATKFPLRSGYLSLDLVNTELVRRGQRLDLLNTGRDVLDWLHEAEEDNTYWDEKLYQQVTERAEQVVSLILEMRGVLRVNYELAADGQLVSASFISYLEQAVEKAPFTYKLRRQKLVPVPLGEAEYALLSLIAYDALTLMEKNKLASLKRCSNPDCVLLFLDEGGRRKWCSMKICGNRKKAARFQQRKADED